MRLLLSILALTLAATGCDSLVRTVTKEPVPLSYVGEITLGEPTTERGRVVVPLEYSGGEWHRNSGTCPHSVEATVVDREIELTVSTSVCTDTERWDAYRLVLPPGTRGAYALVYKDPDGRRHALGTLRIAE